METPDRRRLAPELLQDHDRRCVKKGGGPDSCSRVECELAEHEDATRRKKAEDEWDVHFKTLDQLFTGKKFIFDRMTLADISIFSQLHYLYTVVNYDIPARYKNVNAFMELMRQTLKLESLSDSFEAKSL